MTPKTTKYMHGVTVTDWGKPEYLDGAQMQFMVTREGTKAAGECLAYFATAEDAALFANAKATALLRERMGGAP